jgi:hypothetical protein
MRPEPEGSGYPFFAKAKAPIFLLAYMRPEPKGSGYPFFADMP